MKATPKHVKYSNAGQVLIDRYIPKKDLPMCIEGKTIALASVYKNTHGEEIVSIKFEDKSCLYIETNKDSIKKVSIRYCETAVD
jgi:hypothetical protein